MTGEVREDILRSGFLECFVGRYSGRWGHPEWLGFLKFMQTRFGPFDPDQLGILLEEEKTRYHKGECRTPERELKPSRKAQLRRSAELLDCYLCVDYSV
jgi:hypothetical protein